MSTEKRTANEEPILAGFISEEIWRTLKGPRYDTIHYRVPEREMSFNPSMAALSFTVQVPIIRFSENSTLSNKERGSTSRTRS